MNRNKQEKKRPKKLTSKEQLIEELGNLSQTDLVERLKDARYTNFKCKILLLVLRKQNVLLSFICGFIVNLPISILFNIITIDINKFSILWSEIAYFVTYGLGLLFTAILTAVAFKFSTKYAKISEAEILNASGERIPISTNKALTLNHCIEVDKSGKSPLDYLTNKAKEFIAFAVCSAIMVILLFVFNFFVV